MFECKTLKCHPSAQESLISMYGNAGWTPNSVSEVNNTSTDVEVIGDTIYTTKTNTNYVNITLQKDLKYSQDETFKRLDYAWSKAYDEYGTAEKRYFELLGKRKPAVFIVFAVIFIIFATTFTAMAIGTVVAGTSPLYSILSAVLFFALAGLFIFLFVFNCKRLKKRQNASKRLRDAKNKEYLDGLTKIKNFILDNSDKFGAR